MRVLAVGAETAGIAIEMGGAWIAPGTPTWEDFPLAKALRPNLALGARVTAQPFLTISGIAQPALLSQLVRLLWKLAQFQSSRVQMRPHSNTQTQCQ